MVDDAAAQWFNTGQDLYPELERAIQRAEQEILISVYTFNCDVVGRHFVKLLSERAATGVQVKVVLDALGSRQGTEQLVRDLGVAGIAVKIFRPLGSYFPRHIFSFLYRNHARIFLVDGRTFGLGGICIGDIYQKRRDLFVLVRIEHPQLIRQYFNYIWSLAQAAQVGLELNRAAVVEISPGWRVIQSGPRLLEQRIYQWVLEHCRTARRRILIVSAFFLPPTEILQELCAAQARGINVTVITPLRTDRTDYDGFRAIPVGRLITRGVQWYGINEYFHQKYFIVDEDWCFGSANLDIISLCRNYELNVFGSGGPVLRVLEADVDHLKVIPGSTTQYPGHPPFQKFAAFAYRFAEWWMTASPIMDRSQASGVLDLPNLKPEVVAERKSAKRKFLG
ncbi:MAG: phosphatidylserine/phosphatidylglycerophosphate/cardiolipin synthase family protein [Candidatus Liptonbacteria bacterium]|nr:phosphatidylserine/phosphatidylglycerophosphate/cardiolipin synthase family protein [Candidatus Liptonbacteria bacterium]